METFKAGDVVQLKSGSPSMTITELYNGNQFAYCTWYDFTTNVWFEKRVFPVIALKIFDEADQVIYKEFD